MDTTINPGIWGGSIKITPPRPDFKYYRLTIEENDSNHGPTNYLTVHLDEKQVAFLRDAILIALPSEEIPEPDTAAAPV